MGLTTNLRARMITVATVGTAALVVIVAILTQLLAGRASEADAKAIARARADGVASSVRVDRGQIHVVEGTEDYLDATAWVFDASGRLIEGIVPSSVRVSVTRMATKPHERYVTDGTRLFYVRPLTRGGVGGSVVTTVDLRPFEASERRLLEAVLFLGVLTIGLAAAIAGAVADRSLAVVRHMSAQADEWQGHDLDKRFNLGPARDEMAELGRTLDHMLDRIHDALASERRITDEIAHELRTPLASIRAEAQWGRSHGSGEASTALDAVLAAADRMDTAISTVLDSARTRGAATEACDVAEAIRDLLADGETLDSNGQTEAATSTAVVHALVSPLLENARHHRASWIRVDVVEAAESIEVHVRDDGPGFAADATEMAFAPGWSLTGGHGLGLAVVQRLATSHRISVLAHRGPGGHVEIRIPKR